MAFEIDRYRVSAPLRDGVYVGATSFEDAARAVLPECSFELLGVSEGQWVQYEVTPEGDGTGLLSHVDKIDVEKHGKLVVSDGAAHQMHDLVDERHTT